METFTGKVKNGKFIADIADAFKKAFYPYEGRSVKIDVKELRDTRSNQANRYYWGVVIAAIADYMGERDAEAVHDLMKVECNPRFVTQGKKTFRFGMSTKLDSKEFWDYVERVRQFGAIECGIYIQNPNEYGIETKQTSTDPIASQRFL